MHCTLKFCWWNWTCYFLNALSHNHHHHHRHYHHNQYKDYCYTIYPLTCPKSKNCLYLSGKQGNHQSPLINLSWKTLYKWHTACIRCLSAKWHRAVSYSNKCSKHAVRTCIIHHCEFAVLTVHISMERKPSFTAKHNECGVYFSSTHCMMVPPHKSHFL